MRRLGMVVLIALGVSGCTFAGVKPQLTGAPPSAPPKTLVLGDVQVADPLWESYRLHFRRGLEEWLKRNGGFESVVAEAPAQLPADSIVLVGRITEVDEGSGALRLFVGMGAGQAKVRGTFEIQDTSGVVLAKFSARESYLGGAGIGGAGFLDMEGLVRRFAETVAETTKKWAHGERVEER